MHPCLDSLLLTDDELNLARKQIQELAYFKWQEAGCPDNSALTFWAEAEREWIAYSYVPHRQSRSGDVRLSTK
jgi:hypothetical protein